MEKRANVNVVVGVSGTYEKLARGIVMYDVLFVPRKYVSNIDC